MSRPVTLLAALLALTACQSSTQPPVAEVPPAPPAEDTHAAAAPEEDVEEEEQQQVKVTPALVATYVDYRNKLLEATRVELMAMKERMEKARKDSTSDQLGLLAETGKMSDRLDEKESALQKAAGLDARQVEILDDLVSQLVTGDMIAKQLPDLKPLVESMKEQAKSAPVDQRATILAEIERMEQGAKAMREHTEARATFGNEAVDAVLPQLPALQALRTTMLEIYSKLE